MTRCQFRVGFFFWTRTEVLATAARAYHVKRLFILILPRFNLFRSNQVLDLAIAIINLHECPEMSLMSARKTGSNWAEQSMSMRQQYHNEATYRCPAGSGQILADGRQIVTSAGVLSLSLLPGVT